MTTHRPVACPTCEGDRIARDEDGFPVDLSGQGLVSDCPACGGNGRAHRPVTGATITDEQIRKWWRDGGRGGPTARDLCVALREVAPPLPAPAEAEAQAARARIALALNVMHGLESRACECGAAPDDSESAGTGYYFDGCDLRYICLRCWCRENNGAQPAVN